MVGWGGSKGKPPRHARPSSGLRPSAVGRSVGEAQGPLKAPDLGRLMRLQGYAPTEAQLLRYTEARTPSCGEGPDQRFPETCMCVYTCMYIELLSTHLYIYIYTDIHTCIHVFPRPLRMLMLSCSSQQMCRPPQLQS